MSELLRRGQASSQVSDWHVSSDEVTAPTQQSFFVPHGLTLQQTIQSSGAVTIPAGINWVYVVMAGGGESGFFGYGGRAGEVSWGWTLAQSSCIIGAGGGDGTNAGSGGYTRYGHIIARGGASNNATWSANYYGIPAGTGFGDNTNTAGQPGSNGGRAGSASSGTATGFNGGDGISGGGGSQGTATTGTSTGGNGGSGMAGGGGGGGAGTTTGTRTGGNGGNGIGIDGTIYTGGTGASRTNANGPGGGGAGIAGNGVNATTTSAGNGGLGGGGGGGGGVAGGAGIGGAGILYIYY